MQSSAVKTVHHFPQEAFPCFLSSPLWRARPALCSHRCYYEVDCLLTLCGTAQRLVSRSTDCAPLLTWTEMCCVTSGRSLCLSVWLGLEEQPSRFTHRAVGRRTPSLTCASQCSRGVSCRSDQDRETVTLCGLLRTSLWVSHQNTHLLLSSEENHEVQPMLNGRWTPKGEILGGEDPQRSCPRLPTVARHFRYWLLWFEIMLWLCWGVFRVNLVDSICQLY